MDKQRNPDFKMPNLFRLEARRPPPPPSPIRPPPPSTATGIRMVRHPVPTGKTRTTIADRLEQIIRQPQPIHHNTTKIETVHESPLNLHVTSDPHKEPKKTNNGTNKTTTPSNTYVPGQRDSSSDSLTSFKHKLPLTVPTKAPYTARPRNPNNENKLVNTIVSNNNPVPIKLQATTQTNETYLVSKEDFKIVQMVKERNITEGDFQTLELIKDSGVTKAEIETQLDILKRQKENNNESDCVVIESDSNSVENREAVKECLKHSDYNKNILLAAMELARCSQGIELPLLSLAEEHSAAASRPPSPSTENRKGPSHSSAPSSKSTITFDGISRCLNLLFKLNKSGFRVTSNTPDQTNTQIMTKSNNEAQDKNNQKRSIIHDQVAEMIGGQNSFQRAPLITGRLQDLQQTVQLPQQIDLTMYQPPTQIQSSQLQAPQLQALQMPQPQHHLTQLQTPLQSPQMQSMQIQPTNMPSLQLQLTQPPPPPPPLQQAQTQSYIAQEQNERPEQYYSPRQRNTMPTRFQLAQMKCNPYRATANRPHAPAAMGTPGPRQLFPNDPRRHSMQAQMSHGGNTPRLSRVLSTQEANQAIHASQAVPLPVCNWNFYNTQGTYWPEN